MNACQPGSARPNIFYLCVDDLGTQLGCYGHEQVISPHFDAFAKDSVLFEQAHCQIAICSASRTSILTGLRPEETKLWPLEHDWKAALPDVTSLPEHLQNNGYRTVSIGKVWDPRSGDGTHLGWDDKTEEYGISDSQLAIEALDKNLHTGKPLAMFVGTLSPHCPWEPSDETLAQYDGRPVSPDGPGRTIPWEYLQKCSGANVETLSEEIATDVTRRYYGAVTEVDALIGDFIEALKHRGLYENSLIILWSGDHGYHLGQNDHWGKWTNFSASTRVPLMIRTPHMTTQGERSPRLVECVDMYSTILDIIGLPAPQHRLQGKSFAHLLDNPKAPHKDYGFSVWGFNDDKNLADLDHSIKTERYNFIRWRKGPRILFEGRESGTGNRRMLFDIIADPNETHNLIESEPALAAKLEAIMDEGWRSAAKL